MARAGNLAQEKARFLAAYARAPKGTSLSLFCDQTQEPTYKRLCSWRKHDAQFKRQAQELQERKLADARIRRKGPAVPVETIPEKDPPPPVLLTDQEQAWLDAYRTNGFHAIEACESSGLPFERFEELLEDTNGPFLARFKVLERMKLQRLKDAYLSLAFAAEPDRMAIADNLKRLLPATEAGAPATIYSTGVSGAEQRWGHVLGVR